MKAKLARAIPLMFIGVVAVAYLLIQQAAVQASTTDLIVNGGFETGNFNGWTVINSGSGSWVINNGTFDPPGPGVALAPIAGSFDALSQQGGPGQHVLKQQNVTLPFGITSAVLSWSDRIRNNAAVFSDPNQEWRVLILDTSDVLIQEVFSTNAGDPLQQIGPNNRSFDLTTLMQSLEGQTIKVSFEQQDNLTYFNATLDSVSFLVTTETTLPTCELTDFTRKIVEITGRDLDSGIATMNTFGQVHSVDLEPHFSFVVGTDEVVMTFIRRNKRWTPRFDLHITDRADNIIHCILEGNHLSAMAAH